MNPMQCSYNHSYILSFQGWQESPGKCMPQHHEEPHQGDTDSGEDSSPSFQGLSLGAVKWWNPDPSLWPSETNWWSACPAKLCPALSYTFFFLSSKVMQDIQSKEETTQLLVPNICMEMLFWFSMWKYHNTIKKRKRCSY